MPSYFDKLEAQRRAPPPPPPMPTRMHVDPKTGIPLRAGLDYAEPPNEWHQGARGYGERPPFLPHDRMPRRESDLERPPGFKSDVGVQASPACATRFYLNGAERDRGERPGSAFLSAHFDVVADQGDGVDYEGRGDFRWFDYDAYSRLDYDEIIVPPGRAQGFYPRAGGNPLVDPVPLKPPSELAVPGYKWTSFNDAPPGTSAFVFDHESPTPRLAMHPELRQWFVKISQMRPRGRDDRAHLAKLQGGCVAHCVREFESPGLNAALDAELARRMRAELDRVKALEATETELRARLAEEEARLESETRARAKAEEERDALAKALEETKEAARKAAEEAAAALKAAQEASDEEEE